MFTIFHFQYSIFYHVDPSGFEPLTFCMQNRCSTTELRAQKSDRFKYDDLLYVHDLAPERAKRVSGAGQNRCPACRQAGLAN